MQPGFQKPLQNLTLTSLEQISAGATALSVDRVINRGKAST